MESLIRDGSSIDEQRTAWIAGCELLDRSAAEVHRDWLDGALFRLHSRIWNSRGAVRFRAHRIRVTRTTVTVARLSCRGDQSFLSHAART